MQFASFLKTRCIRSALLTAYLGVLVCSVHFILNGKLCVADEGSVAEGRRLVFVESIEHPDLVGVNRLVVSSDNAFLYAASWRGDNLSIFSRSSDGKLKHLRSLKYPMLKGAIKLVFNHDESWLAVICMRSSTILLFARDAETGQLKPEGFGKAEMVWPTSVSFSPNSDFLYVGDAGGTSSSKAQSSIVIFRVKESGGFEHVGEFLHPEMIGMRNVFLSPDGSNAYALCSSASCVFSCQRDAETGELTMLQQVRDGDGDIARLHGVHSAWFSLDGKRLYTIAGRFEGSNAVTVFNRGADGKLTPIYNWESEEGFGGGNDIQVTADERTIIVSGTTGDSLVVLDNDVQGRKLKLRSIIPSDDKILLKGPSGITFDAKQEFLHVAVENGNALTTFGLTKVAQ